MRFLVFCLEEPSARVMLEAILPKILPEDIEVRFVVFRGKQDLEKQLVKRLRGWCTPQTRFVVLRDQDSGDCEKIKAELAILCRQGHRAQSLVRVACHELESFYLGDLKAVERGLGLAGLVALQNKRRFSTPDAIARPAQVLKKITNKQYQKIAGSRAIAPYLNLEENRSHSFCVLVQGIQKLVARESWD